MSEYANVYMSEYARVYARMQRSHYAQAMHTRIEANSGALRVMQRGVENSDIHRCRHAEVYV